MKAQFALIGYEVPSQNVTMRRHWSKNHAERKRLERWIRVLVGGRVPPATGLRKLRILAIRKKLIADDANLRGGAKGLVDAIVAAGLLTDDRDGEAIIDYDQQTVAVAGVRKPTTIITIEDP